MPIDDGEPQLFLDLTDTVGSEGNEQGGLLGIAFDPGGTAMYLHYADLDGDTAVDVHLLDADGRSIEVVEVFRTKQPHVWHNGGAVLVDEAGTVWISLGDGGLEIDRSGQGQDPTTVLGALLRFEPSADHRSLVPAAGNSFLGTDDGADAVWAFGLRNPWRLWIDKPSQRAVIADVGDNCSEEINVIGLDEPGANFGWRDVEGPWTFGSHGPENAVSPRYTYPRGPGACAVIGGVGADQARYPTLEGRYLFSDLCANDILALDLDGDGPPVPLDIGVRAATTFATGLDGTIYVGSLSEGVVRLDSDT